MRTVALLRGCQRCGQDHSKLKFQPLTNPVDSFEWWALCPVTQEPILLLEQRNKLPPKTPYKLQARNWHR